MVVGSRREKKNQKPNHVLGQIVQELVSSLTSVTANSCTFIEKETGLPKNKKRKRNGG